MSSGLEAFNGQAGRQARLGGQVDLPMLVFIYGATWALDLFHRFVFLLQGDMKGGLGEKRRVICSVTNGRFNDGTFFTFLSLSPYLL